MLKNRFFEKKYPKFSYTQEKACPAILNHVNQTTRARIWTLSNNDYARKSCHLIN